MAEDLGWGEDTSDDDEEDVLIQFWEANRITSKDGRKYWELTTQNKPFNIIYDAGGGLSLYRKQSLHHTIIIQDDDVDDVDDVDELVEGNRLQTLISRVFRNQRPERSTSYYARHNHSNKDFPLNCGIGSSLYIPTNKSGDFSGSPSGVMEYVSTCEEYLEKFRMYLGLTFYGQKRKMFMYGDHLYGFGRLNILEHAILEMDQLLNVVCQKFPLPLAQYWVTKHGNIGDLRVMYQKSHTEMKIYKFLDKFKQACMEMRVNRDEGLVGTAYESRKTFFCNDIKELSKTNKHLAQCASYSISIPCFIIRLNGISPECKDCILEFFLPPKEFLTYNPRNLLYSLWATMKKYLPSFMSASGEQLGQVLLVEVIDFATRKEPQFFKLGEWTSSLSRHEYEDLPSQELCLFLKLLRGVDEHIVDICSTTNSNNETATGETSKRAHTRDNIAEIMLLDKLEEESSIKCTEPLSLSSKSKRSRDNEGDHSALETTLEVAIKHKQHTLAADRDDLVEEPPIVDIGYDMSNEDVQSRMNMIFLPQQAGKEKMVLDTSAHNNRNILGAEKDNRTISIIHKTCPEVHTSKREIKPQEDISFESLKEQFGRPLDDAAASFGVSRSTFKRICRGHGIKRWQYGKRTMGANISLNRRKKLNDEETSRRNLNFSHISMPSSHNTVDAYTSQNLNKMTIKATYKGITIRFELPDLSGLADLEDNVIERLHLERKSFSIKYQDDEDDWILIACDKDMQECMGISRSLKKTAIKMSIDPPINIHQAP